MLTEIFGADQIISAGGPRTVGILITPQVKTVGRVAGRSLAVAAAAAVLPPMPSHRLKDSLLPSCPTFGTTVPTNSPRAPPPETRKPPKV